jgi:hypothetical protein
MSKALTVGLVVVAALLVTCFGGAYYLYNTYGKEAIAQSKMALEEGSAFAVNSDQNGCVSETRVRSASDTTLMGMMTKQMMFLQACLSKSAPTAGFCDSVPIAQEVSKAVEWKKSVCGDMQVTDPRCEVLGGVVASHCQERKSA